MNEEEKRKLIKWNTKLKSINKFVRVIHLISRSIFNFINNSDKKKIIKQYRFIITINHNN